MGASAVATVLAFVALAAGPALVRPAVTATDVPTVVGVAAGCGWRQTASELHDVLARATDAAGVRLRESLAAAGAGSAGFLDGCSTGSGRRGKGLPTEGCERPFFPRADWLWNPIPSGAALDPESSAMAAELASGDHILNTGEFGVTLLDADEVTASTPRSAVSLSADWGPDPLAGLEVPVPASLRIPPGSDGHVAIADAATDTVVNLWVARRSGDGLAANWGAATALGGDGREHNGSSTGAGIARYAAVVRASEIADGHIPHALFFSTNVVEPDEVRYPATKTDGSNMDGADSPIPEGARVQLDPGLDVDTIPGISEGEKTIATALQTYGAYVGDNGGARMAFIAEYAPDSDAYAQAGLSGDFVALGAIPWDRLQVLSDWSGGTAPIPGDEKSTTTRSSGCTR